MEGEVELCKMVEINESIAEFSQIENESVLPESEANLDEYGPSYIQDEEDPVEDQENNQAKEGDNVEKIQNHKPHEKQIHKTIRFK